MSDTLTLTEFPPVSRAAWDEVVLKDQKGVAPKTRLYYRAEDLEGLEYLDSAPGEFPFTRGTRRENQWSIREVVQDAAGAKAALNAGADEIGYAVGKQDIFEVLDALPRCTVHFEAGERAHEVFEALATTESAGLAKIKSGSLDYEPFGESDHAVKLLRALSIPNFRAINVRADRRFSEYGATPVQELGYTIAAGVEILAGLTDRGMTVDEAAQAMAFTVAVGSNYFQEIAKLRAARTLWARAVAAFQPASADSARMTIYARTGHRTKTIYDPYVNVLRVSTEAMAAAIGGADAIEVEAFDRTYRAPDEASRRLARNTQLMLKKEAGLDRSVDPAGGSYYLETLTDSLAREAWGLFQQIEAAGGFWRYSESSALARDLARSEAEREGSVSTRRTSIVGTNQYPNLQERMLPTIECEDTSARDARVFETIRLQTERYAARTGHTPRFLLLEAGDLKMRKARSGFATNFFGCAGFEIETAEAITGNPDAIVLCSSDAEYAELAPRVIQGLRDAGKATPVMVAGNPVESIEQLKQAGVADFVHVRSNAAEVLRSWQERLGVRD